VANVLCLVHEDGHVVALANGGELDKRLRIDHAAMTAIGITGYTLTRMEAGAAAEAHLAGLNCGACRITCPCGCIPEHVAAGWCPHGTAEAIRKAAIKAGAR
jgi:hypothetical protein